MSGIEYLYDHLTDALFDAPDPEMAPEVCDIFQMFRMLDYCLKQIPDKTGIDLEMVRFRGYDGNHESQHYAFAKFVIEKLHHFGESKPANSHWRTLPCYRRMLEEWKRSIDTSALTRDEIIRIVDAGKTSSAPMVDALQRA